MTRYPISYQNGGQMAKIDTLFLTKTAEKPLPFVAAHTPPPPGGSLTKFNTGRFHP